MKRLRIAVIGCGAYPNSRARSYLATICKLGDHFDLCAICDQGKDARKEAGERFGVHALYGNAEEMLSREQPDIAFVLVPTDGQSVVALSAMGRGIHVLTEIPAAITLGLADALDEASRANGVKWEIAENVWLWPQEQLKQKIVSEGHLGQVTLARLSYCSGAYHGLNAVRKILGREGTRVLGHARKLATWPYLSYGGEEAAARWWETGIIEFEGDVPCLFELPVPGPRGNHWEIEGTRGYLCGNDLVLFEGGRDNTKRQQYAIQFIHTEVDGEQVLEQVRVDTPEPVVWDNPFTKYKITSSDDVAKASILCSIHRAAAEGANPQYGVWNAKRDYELWLAVRESAANGSRWVELPLQNETQLEKNILDAYTRRYGHAPFEYTKLLDANFGRTSVMWTEGGWL